MLPRILLVFWFMVAAAGLSREPTPPLQPRKAPALPSGKAMVPLSPLLLPVVGGFQQTRSGDGDTLLRVARRFNADSVTLARLNHLRGNTITPGMLLTLPTRAILPLHPRQGIVINIPERGLYVFEDGALLARYPVAVGQPTWRTPVGTYRVTQLVQNPTWLPPREMMRREGAKAVKVPPGPKNPLGDRWIGWSKPEVGFHSTWIVESIGQAASHGCVRMYPESAHSLFDLVDVGTPIYAVYEPVKIGREGNRLFLSVSPDIYRLGMVSVSQVRKRLKAAGVDGTVSEARLRQIVADQDGYPHEIATLPASNTATEASARSARIVPSAALTETDAFLRVMEEISPAATNQQPSVDESTR